MVINEHKKKPQPAMNHAESPIYRKHKTGIMIQTPGWPTLSTKLNHIAPKLALQALSMLITQIETTNAYLQRQAKSNN